MCIGHNVITQVQTGSIKYLKGLKKGFDSNDIRVTTKLVDPH